MFTTYAQTCENWKDWQYEYRFGVLLIFPSEPLRSQVNALRAIHDPQSQATCDAHISLTIPLPRPMSDHHWQELEHLTADMSPLSIQYGPLRHYLPYPGVVFDIQPQEQLANLVHVLERTSAFTGAPERSHPFSAHMTIAEFISAERTLTLIDELHGHILTGSFHCSAVSYAVPDERFHFTERKQLRLAR